ncbi:MAG TPA: ATP-binding protein [Blastocatellia bacterium]|nr:ATP-binding protein [Blastocatellia bacterium]
MTPNWKARFGIWGTTLLALVFVFFSASLILSVRYNQNEAVNNELLIASLADVSKAVQDLKNWRDDIAKPSPTDHEVQWKSRYIEYSKANLKIGSQANHFRSVKDDLSRAAALVQSADALHSVMTVPNPSGLLKNEIDFTSALDRALVQIDNSTQTVRRAQSQIRASLAQDWQRLIIILMAGCVLAGAVVIVSALYERNLRKLRHTEMSLLHTRNGLDARVEERTKKIAAANKALRERNTERNRAQEALRESEERYRNLVEMSPNGLAVYCEGQIVYINPTGAELFGAKDTADVAGKLVIDLFHPDDCLEIQERLNKLLEDKNRISSLETRISKIDGTFSDIEMGAIPCSFHGKPAAQLVIRDVTASKRLEDQLRQAQKMEAVGRLAGGVSHDFNNLLTAILGYSEYLLNSYEPGDAKRTFVDEIKRAAERAAGLTRQLLAFSRKQTIEPKVFGLNSVVIDVERMLKRLIGENVTLVTVLDPTLNNIKADPGEIEQVIMNLALNARDAMPDGGKLTIRTANIDSDDIKQVPITNPANSYVMLEVSDNGCGMDREAQRYCLEPFYTTKESGKGTGLGLSTVYAIVQKANGHLHLTSDLGAGTTFTIYFPTDTAAVETVAEAQESVTEPEPEPVRAVETILIVEDDNMVREMIREILKKTGYNMLEAENGIAAVQLSRMYEGVIDMVITDVVMPQMNGRELVEKLIEARPQIKAIYMSGYTHDAIMKYGLGNIDGAFMQKPFASAALVSKVREVLDQAICAPPPQGKQPEMSL